MAKIQVLLSDPTGVSDIAPSASPGALLSYGFTDLLSSKLGLKNQCFYIDANADELKSKIPITMSAQDGGEIQVDYNPLSTGHPVENFNGGLGLYLNGVSGLGGGYGLVLDNNGNPTAITVSGVRHIFNGSVGPGLNRLRVTFRCISAGTGFMDCRWSIQDLANGLALIESGSVCADARYPIYNGGLPVAGIAAISGFYTSFGKVLVSKYDATGPLNVVDQPYADWRSKTVIRVIGQVANGGTGTYTYQWYYRQGSSGSWTTIGTSGGDTGTSSTCTKHGLIAGISYQFYRTVSDGVTTLTSSPVGTATAAAGVGSYISILTGDSITEGEGAPVGPVNRDKALVTALTTLSVESRFLNLGEGATTSSTLAGTYLTNLRALCADLIPDAVDCLYGTNDVNSGYTKATFKANMDACASALQTDGVRFVMHAPIYQQGLTGPNEALLGPSTLNTGYPSALAEIAVARNNCYVGDVAAFGHFQTNVATWFASVGEVHPNALGYSAGLGPDEASAIKSLLSVWYVATTYTITGPVSGTVGVASTAFTVTPIGGVYTGTVTVTPSGCGLSSPLTFTFSGSSTPQTFTITPVGVGSVTLTGTNNSSLTNPSSVTYTSDAVITTFLFNDVYNLVTTGLVLNGLVLDSAGGSLGSALTKGFVEIGSGFYSFAGAVSSGNSLKVYQAGTPGTVLALSKLPQNRPPIGTVVTGSTASSLVISGLPSGRNYLGQVVYHISSSESRVISTSVYNSGNYTIGLGSSGGENGPLSSNPTAGDSVLIVP